MEERRFFPFVYHSLQVGTYLLTYFVSSFESSWVGTSKTMSHHCDLKNVTKNITNSKLIYGLFKIWVVNKAQSRKKSD